MKYYEIIANGGGLNSKDISLSPVEPNIINSFDTNKVILQEPIEIQAHYYHQDDREDDYVCAGNPQVVSEEFKRLVEELDPNSAQFFETKSLNCTTQKKYYLMHVTQVISCLDREHSKFLPGFAGKKETIAVGVVDESKINPNVHIFRLEENVLKHYVSEKFYKEYRKRQLRGCEFYLRTINHK